MTAGPRTMSATFTGDATSLSNALNGAEQLVAAEQAVLWAIEKAARRQDADSGEKWGVALRAMRGTG